MLNKRHKVSSIVSLLMLLWLIPVIYYISVIYSGGDQISYHDAYYSMNNGMVQNYLKYNLLLGSFEFVHFLTISAASQFFEKNIFFTFINFIFLISGIYAVSKNTLRPYWLICILFLSNYYVHVLLFSAERLKLGFLFFFLAMIFHKTTYKKYFFIIMSILTHFSLIGLYAALSTKPTIDSLKRFFRYGRIPLIFFPLTILIILATIYIAEPILIKIIAYKEDYGGLSNVIQLSSLILLGYIYAKNNKSQLLIFLFVIMLMAFFVGDSRLNMFGILYFQYHFLKYERIFSIPFILLSIYVFYKLIDFYIFTFLYGDAFYGL